MVYLVIKDIGIYRYKYIYMSTDKEMSKYNLHFSYGNILTTTLFNVWKLLQ
jgi:hypothetical protein